MVEPMRVSDGSIRQQVVTYCESYLSAELSLFDSSEGKDNMMRSSTLDSDKMSTLSVVLPL